MKVEWYCDHRLVKIFTNNPNNEVPSLSLTRLNMLFTPTLPVKAEFTAMLGMLSIAENAEECWAVLSNA